MPGAGSTADMKRRPPAIGPTGLIVLLFGIILVVLGAAIVRDFGTSIDEYRQVLYAQLTVESYLGQSSPTEVLTAARGLGHGPFFVVTSLFLSRVIAQLPFHFDLFQARHLTYYLSFVLGSISLLLIVLRYASWPAAISAAALYVFQPVIFGHAFINPKDTPLLGFFTTSVALGVYAIDGLPIIKKADPVPRASLAEVQGSRKAIRKGPGWSLRWIVALVLVLILGLVSIVDLASTHWSLTWAVGTLRSVYRSETWPVLSALFRVVATDAWKTPLNAYVAKLLGPYVIFASLWIASLILLTCWLVAKIILREGLSRALHRNRQWILLAVAGVFLGLTASIRVVGLFAGVLVCGLLFWRYGVRGWYAGALYCMIAGVVSLATWPYLWGHPVSGLLSSLQMTGGYSHETSVLFRGTSYLSTNLPWDFVGWLMLIQFTLPLFPLVLWGALRAIVGNRFSRQLRRELIVLSIWFWLPLVAFVILRPTIYGNFRLLLFITPPLFIFAALGIQGLWDLVRSKALRMLLIAAILAPGVVGIVRLHPYEYVYYNSLVGGTGGAFHKYEMDYWCTSLREATRDLNQIADDGETVAVLFRDTDQVAPFARPDIKVVHARTVNDVLGTRPEAVLVCSPNFGFDHAEEWATLAEVGREGAVFSKVLRGPKQ